jgi:dihydrodipicolinate synthase/N-acetylneuraminate lyase
VSDTKTTRAAPSRPSVSPVSHTRQDGGESVGGGPTHVDPPETATGGSGLVRVTVNLLPVAAQSLDRLCDETGYSKTDVINRALQVYEVWQQVAAQNGGTVVVKHDNGETERIRLL